MRLAHEMTGFGITFADALPTVHCRCFEDNEGAVEIAKVPKMRPRTKHMSTKYFHFRHWVENGSLSVHKITTENQPSDGLTKALSIDALRRHRLFLQGWDTTDTDITAPDNIPHQLVERE